MIGIFEGTPLRFYEYTHNYGSIPANFLDRSPYYEFFLHSMMVFNTSLAVAGNHLSYVVIGKRSSPEILLEKQDTELSLRKHDSIRFD